VIRLERSMPAPARAQLVAEEKLDLRSEQRFALEIRLGPYRPNIDSEFDGTGRTPFRDYFGTSRRLMTQVEFDYQFYQGMGTAAVGLGVGYFSATGHNLLEDPVGGVSADTSKLKLIPISLSGVYRFDVLFERYKVPLVPYGKLGLDYVMWFITNGNGETPHAGGGVGRGGTLGWHAAVGLQLVLDFFEPDTARQLDTETGVNHTHLFVELGHWNVSGFGQSGKLHVGDTTWMTGLLVEF
jgi:hypothetical protein